MADSQTTPQPGQIWVPTKGRAYPKIVCHLGNNGIVYAARYPRVKNVLPSCFPPERWKQWVSEHEAAVKDQTCPSK